MMTNESKKLTDGIIVYSPVVSEYEKLDFRNDALAGVRANYFNSNCSLQRETTEIVIDGNRYLMSYVMQKGKPISWKLTRNKLPFQTIKISSEDFYSVIFYAENGNVYKRMYFNGDHIWLRTEYFSKNYSNKMLCKIAPKIISGIFALKISYFRNEGSVIEKTLFPSDKMPSKKSACLVYSNMGMIWYDEEFRPTDLADEENEPGDKGEKFVFYLSDLPSDNRSALDLEAADYLDYQSLTNEGEEQTSCEEKAYSAYEKIENILFEANKTNKDIFGEILSNASDSDFAETEEETETDKLPVEAPTELSSEQETSPEKEEAQNEVPDEDLSDDDNVFEKEEEPVCDSVITSNSGKYKYYGGLNSDNLREGRGRTVSPSGVTSYDGEYKDDKRSGFGICYYKGGEINYVGSWQENKRSGSGVGYRQSDGTMHAGRWNNNMPEGLGARFDKDGNFIELGSYKDGTKDGISLSFDENNNVIISKWENGERISEQTILTGEI